MPKDKKKKRKHKKKTKIVRDRHLLYEAAVQNPDADLDYFQRVYKSKRKRPFKLLREDFSGTSQMACTWVLRKRDHRAWGVDLHRPTLDWARRHRVSVLGDARKRLTLIEADVREVKTPKVDVVAALNFSYSVFKERSVLLSYFRAVRKSMRPGGIFFTDAFGGMETMSAITEKRKIAAETCMDGTKVPAFKYIWEQARFNAISHDILCHIHFKLPDGTRIRRAFTYDWRLWTLPELQELMLEAGFASTEVYVDKWIEKEDDSDGIYRRRRYFENQEAWIAYVVGFV